jgi:phospholipase C
MPFRKLRASLAYQFRLILALVAVIQFGLLGPAVGSISANTPAPQALTPIRHVIIIVGENRTFDHLFATYKRHPGESVNNLLSEEIIKEDGSPSPNFSLAHQYSANVTGSPLYQFSPTSGKALYAALPAPLNGGPTDPCADNGICTLKDATSSEDGLSDTPTDYYQFLLTGGTGLVGRVPDTRIQGVNGSAPFSILLPGPFQLTNSVPFPYDSYAASPVHRFYQMWQQEDCSALHATMANPSGCLADLFVWTEVTVGSHVNGKTQPPNFSTDYAPGKITTGEGATAMAFYNMLKGDAPYTKELADSYAMRDNYHQPVMGGTGANSIMLGFGDENGGALVPPHNQMTFLGAQWTKSKIPIRLREPTTGGPKTATADSATTGYPRECMAEGATANARTTRNRASARH